MKKATEWLTMFAIAFIVLIWSSIRFNPEGIKISWQFLKSHFKFK